MKKTIFLSILLMVSFCIHAQEKPTKEQTVEYITSFFASHYVAMEMSSGQFVQSKDYRFSLDNTVVTLKSKQCIWGTGNPPKYRDETLQFDFKEIERMNATKTQNSKGCAHGIVFNAYNEKKTIKRGDENASSAIILIYGAGSLDCDSDLYGMKIYKALNYLAELCGMAKPLNF